jgi:predicted O-linked N-acetylglucosamine transferase (SPINDLY family)
MSTERLQAGMVLLRTRQFDSAEKFFRSCLNEEDSAAAWFYLGVAQHGGGRLQSAVDSLAKAIARSPELTQAREARAAVLVALNRPAEAESELRAAIAAGVAGAQVLVNLAIVMEQQGTASEALALYEQALACDPGHYAARLNRGALLLSLKRPVEALSDFDLLPRELADTHTNRARALFELHRDADALDAADRALQVEPSNARALLDRIIALASLGRLGESAAALADARRRGIALTSLPGGPRHPEQLDPTALYVGRALARQWVCDWRDRDDLLRAIRSSLAQPARLAHLAEPGILFHSLSLPLDATELRALADAVAQKVRDQAAGVRLRRPLAAVSGGHRIKVAFLCTTLRDHPGARLLRRIFVERDRATFEYVVFALHPDLRAPVARDIQGSADALFDVTGWSSAEIAERLRAEHLDVLLDDGGYLEGCRPELLALRAAPVQVEYLGTPSTLGAGIADYRLNDGFSTPPEWQPGWAERLALMNHPTYVFDTDAQPGRCAERDDYGLPREGFVWCCFNQARKIEPQVFDIWMRLLTATRGSVLWLLDAGSLTRANLRREAQARGVAPERLVFASRVSLEEHLGRHAHADVFLDTLFFNAHTTAVDALWGGVPLITCAGSTMASRVAGSFLKAAGLEELTVRTLPEYEAKALEIARSPALLERLKRQVADAKGHSKLFDATAGVRAFERALKAMVERQRAGLRPDTLIVD